ncbi:dual specificity protein phosphatase family protein [Halocatena marina]|uniref:Dual specificity protein phosphatase family protein n=1 Tax=Halocatena marina TaxID=2934937 RepID=A0ABD5YY69_9EURY|nr:dual specificity protein phosphatase [Halocatena marina]
MAAVYQTDDGGDWIVRPLHHIEDEPIIRPIGERDLYLGNWRAADSAYHDRTFDHVLSATSSTPPMTTHHCPLTDGPDNEWRAFERAVDTARQLYRRDGSLLIHCTAGISRSSTLIATTIAAEEDRQLHDALSIVKQVRPMANPNPALHEWAVIYLATQE